MKHKDTNYRDCYYVKSILMRLLLLVRDVFTVDLPFLGQLTDTTEKFSDRERGAIHFIGTRGRTRKAFESPGLSKFSERQRVRVRVGLLLNKDYSDLGEAVLLRNNVKKIDEKAKALGRESCSGVWILGDSNRHPYFLIDLGEGRCISPTHYSILDGNAGSAFRNWELHGSVDGNIFFILRRHLDDKRQPKNLDKGTWTLKKEFIEALFNQPQHKNYVKELTKNGTRMPHIRYFRIVKTALGSSNSWYLGVAGFEVFGEYQYGGANNDCEF